MNHIRTRRRVVLSDAVRGAFMIGSSSTALLGNDCEHGPGAGTASERAGRYAADGGGIRVAHRVSGAGNDGQPPARILQE